MNASDEGSVPSNAPARPENSRTPSKPKPTSASVEQLLAHYHAQLPAYLEAIARDPSPTAVAMQPIDSASSISKDELVELIRKQNFRLGRFVRPRAHALLQQVVGTNEDGRTYGHSYDEILAILAAEFPEGSTSAAALRWYVVHMWSDADDEGLPRPTMPQVRPRSNKKKKSHVSNAAA